MIDQVHEADGDPALQKAGEGSQRDLNSLAGLQHRQAATQSFQMVLGHFQSHQR